MQGDRQHVFDLTVAELFCDGGIVGGALDAMVPAAIVVGAVAVVFAVALVVLGVVGDEIVECEAVVTGDEVYALLGFAVLVAVDGATSEDAVGEGLHEAVVAAEEAADIVAESAVPLLP